MSAHRHEPRGRDHEYCLCGCGASLQGMRADARYATEACKYRDRRRRPPASDARSAAEQLALQEKLRGEP